MENEILDFFGEEDFYKGKIIAVKYFYFESQAQIYAARLREHGIRSFISNTNTITAFPLGNGGIGLHNREIDRRKSVSIIKELDKNNIHEPQNISFHDADHEDISYEKTLKERKTIKEPLLILLLVILSLIIFRAFIRAKGLFFWADPF